MNRFAQSFVITIALSLFGGSVFAQGVWTPEMQLKTKAISAARVSPDGKRVVYAVAHDIVTPDKSEYVSQIYLVNADGTGNMQLTFADKSSSNPKWSPDGSSIAFTSTRKDNKSNLYVLRLGGGEAEMLTDVKSGAQNFEWSPDGKHIAFIMTDPKTDEEEKNDKGRNDYRWVDENTKHARLYVIPVMKDANGKREARKLTAANFSVSAMDWSPDSSKIVFSHVKSTIANDWPTADVSVIDVTGGRITTLANTGAAESSPTYSPDGRWIAISLSDNPPRWAQSNRIAIIPAGGGAPRPMAYSPDEQPGIIGWSADGKMIYFSEAKGTDTGLYTLDIAANKVSEVDKMYGVFNTTLSPKSGLFAFVWQSAMSPPEIYVAPVSKVAAPVKITNVNAEAAKMPMPKTDVIKWKAKDGKEIEGLLTYPVGYQSGQKVPFILNIHGGPAGVFQKSFVGGRGVYPLASMAQKGYAILRPNPRGSSGYGTAFRRANFKDWGGMDYEDLMLGVDKAIEMGVADPSRLGVMGWSYGGYMTSTIVTKTKRFKAASAGAPVTNMMSFNGTADIPDFIPDYFGGNSWDNLDIYVKHSAMFNVKGVSTPTLIQHGEADLRVPIAQGYEFYNALKQQGVPTRMVVLPRQPHGPNEPKMQLICMQSNLDWFDKYLK
jgi:dipeptidyl aminopeptidase/acylaminoacyl peptidase